MTISLATITKTAEAQATATLMDGGSLKLYTGTPPATANTALSGNTLLGSMAFSATFAASVAAGVATAAAISNDTAADASGTATFFRSFKSDGTSVVMQGTVTATGGGGDATIPSTTITALDILSCTGFTYTRPT